MTDLSRREFVAASGAALASSAALAAIAAQPAGPQLLGSAPAPTGGSQPTEGDAHRGSCFIASGNGLRVTDRAMSLTRGGAYLLDAIVDGISIVENDPHDNSVGYGGLPNEDGVVQLDASVMDGPTARAGAVGALEKTKNAAAVALQVLRRTGHVLLVGQGATRFARELGFPEEDLLTESSRQEWLKWKANLNKDDWWLDEQQQLRAPSGPTGGGAGGHGQAPSSVHRTSGTVHCSGLDDQGRMAAATSTSGLSWKIPGRCGDSPIVGAGMYCDNEVGCSGSTGRGESTMQTCAAYSVVRHMAEGKSPTEACLAALKEIIARTKLPDLLTADGRPAFDVTMYALRKDGAYSAATIWRGTGEGRRYAVHDGQQNRLIPCAYLYDGDAPPAQRRPR